MPSPDFIEDCLIWRGRVLTGSYAHWCPEWDDLPIDETCPEWPCGCGFGDCKAMEDGKPQTYDYYGCTPMEAKDG